MVTDVRRNMKKAGGSEKKGEGEEWKDMKVIRF